MSFYTTLITLLLDAAWGDLQGKFILGTPDWDGKTAFAPTFFAPSILAAAINLATLATKLLSDMSFEGDYP